MDLPEAQVANLEDYMAQWDVMIVNPQDTKDRGVSLDRIRQVNPNIKILAWIPIGQSSLGFEMSDSMPGLPLDQGGKYFLSDTNGELMQYWWGGYYMNPFKEGFAFPKQVVSYLKAHYLVPGMYDGVMFDSLFYSAPNWGAPSGLAEVNGITTDNGFWFTETQSYGAWMITRTVTQDDLDYRSGNTYLLQAIGTEVPGAIVTGNGVSPWIVDHFTRANGSLVESAFGDEFGSYSATWPSQWQNYQLLLERLGRLPQYVMINADVRHGRTDPEARDVPGMTTEDMRRFRLSLTTTLLGDGYFAFDRGDGNHAQLWWFPEYEVDLGNPASGYEAPNSFRTDQYGAGTYSREFTNGSVVVNPTDGPMTVTFISDRSDASTKVRATSFVLPANDGRIYMK
jgi:hypothetical protein